MSPKLADLAVPSDAPMVEIEVCICTYRRASLEETLRSLGQQRLPAQTKLRVIVADNDETPSAEPLARRTAAALGLELIYIHAPFRNISIARNACLDATTADLVAFIDDDETADPGWLSNLFNTLENEAADIVFGRVEAVYGPDVPAWMQKADLHSIRAVVRRGSIRTGYTCNVLMRRKVFSRLRFELGLGRSGGEDTVFFDRLWRQGSALAFSSGAVTREPVPPARANLRWLLLRSFRAGQTHAFIQKASGANRLSLAIAAASKAAVCALLTGFSVLAPSRSAAALVRSALHVGAVAGFLGRDHLQLY